VIRISADDIVISSDSDRSTFPIIAVVARITSLLVPSCTATKGIAVKVKWDDHAIDAGLTRLELNGSFLGSTLNRIENDLDALAVAVVTPLSGNAFIVTGVEVVTKSDWLASAIDD
jgi:hypothetical protein